MLTQCQTKKREFTVDYPEACVYTDKQSSIFWPHFEVKVHKDKHDILVNMSEAERHGTITVLKLFTIYEVAIGDDFWLNFVFKKFPRPADIQPMAALFSAMELAVHAKFYSKLNEELGFATDEFYNEYLKDPELKSRIDFLHDTLKRDDLRALGIFTFFEGAVLYSSFAYLKHFQSQGKNKLVNVVSGINFSARDEALHSEAAAWLFRTLLKEKVQAGLISEQEEVDLKADIADAALKVYEHEQLIIKKIFEKGAINGITEHQLNNFAMSRINLCLRNLGYDGLVDVTYNPIGEWFYDGINGYQAQDFFNSQGNQYNRDCDTSEFTF